MLRTTTTSIFLLLALELYGIVCLRLIQVEVPTQRQTGDSAILFCRFDLNDEPLYSVKWYKGGKEFFRFVPKDIPPVQTFPVDGISVNVTFSDQHKVMIENITLQSGGRFKCEVSAEAPSFQTVYGYGEMSVIALPSNPPEINGAKATYQIGDLLTANCTSSKSKPMVNLTWLINGKKASEDQLKKYPPRQDLEGLEWTILGLTFTVKQLHFTDGGLHLTCTASMSAFQWEAQQNVTNGNLPVQQDLPRQRTLASRPAAATSGTSNSSRKFNTSAVGLFVGVGFLLKFV